jgi:hypothetical protein
VLADRAVAVEVHRRAETDAAGLVEVGLVEHRSSRRVAEVVEPGRRRSRGSSDGPSPSSW